MDRTTQFLDVFQAFLDEVVQEHRMRERRPASDSLIAALETHLGADPRRLPVVTEEIAAYRFVDLDISLARIAERGDGPARVLGIGGGEQRRHNALSEMLESAAQYGQFPIATVDYTSVATGPDTTREAVAFGLRLFTYEGSAVAVLQRGADQRMGDSAAMEVLCASPGVASALITAVGREMLEHSVLRGQVLTLGASAYEAGVGGITFHRRPELTRDDIILPPGVLDRLHRHVAGVARHRDRLRAAGQHLKRGLLLYGPPGTGKTHTVRYLLGALPDLTVMLLSGPSIQHVSEAARMARALQPALVVLEDCDLVAENRDYHDGAQPLLFEVLEALDGLSDDADVAFLLTTNRVEALEPALAQRPGRVDLAIQIPLPDGAGRRALLGRYARSLPFTTAALDDAAAGAEGMTASFMKELVRRAVLIAAEDDRAAGDADLAQALTEMTGEADEVTRILLGAAPDEEE